MVELIWSWIANTYAKFLNFWWSLLNFKIFHSIYKKAQLIFHFTRPNRKLATWWQLSLVFGIDLAVFWLIRWIFLKPCKALYLIFHSVIYLHGCKQNCKLLASENYSCCHRSRYIQMVCRVHLCHQSTIERCRVYSIQCFEVLNSLYEAWSFFRC